MTLYTIGFKILLFFLLAFGIAFNSSGQNYGLGISTPEVLKETTTALDLSPDNPLRLDGNFEISFEVSLMPSGRAFFGYVLRIIEDNERNFDLLYTAQVPENPFEIVVGDDQTKIRLNIAPDNFIKQWNKIKITFDSDKDRLTVYNGYKAYVQEGLHLKKSGSYKLLFGANNDKKFKTNDALPVKFRNIRVLKNNITKYHWPLDEHEGEVAHELIEGNDGRVKNPLWMASMHQNWQKVGEFLINGASSVAFDSKNESLFIIGQDSLFTFSLPNSVLSAKSNQEKFKTNHGSQSIYNSMDDHIYNFLPDLKTVAGYSLIEQKWDTKFPHWQATDYWHANKVISSGDSSIYVFGGYGHLKYKNTVRRFSLKKQQWEDIEPVGDFFTPRYLSALGANVQGDTIYVLGGYGNSSGLQLINPKNIYSMMRFTTKDGRFKKLYEMKNQAEDFSFANSLVINNSSKTYYGLVFPQHKYNSNLRLLVGSLKDNIHKLIGTSIPYRFNDIHSYADLFYCPQSEKFVAVTLLRSDNDQTTVSVYTLQGPPLDFVISTSATDKQLSRLILFFVLFVVFVGDAVLFYLSRRKHKKPLIDKIKPIEQDQKSTLIAKNSIFLFGDLQIFDQSGADITKLFTPLLKELFLLLLVNSIKNGRGLHADKLEEILWFGKSEKSVRNNRSVNLAKLKSILEGIEHCQLLKDAGYWKIEVDYEYWDIDYQNYLNLIEAKKKLDEEQVRMLFELTRRGNFLSNHHYEWLDQFKAEISNEVIDVFLLHANSSNSYNPEFLIQIASFIFYFDPVSEEAMVIKCKALSSLGKHSLAKNAYDVFVKDYRSIYNEDFNKNFNEII